VMDIVQRWRLPVTTVCQEEKKYKLFRKVAQRRAKLRKVVPIVPGLISCIDIVSRIFLLIQRDRLVRQLVFHGDYYTNLLRLTVQ
jgi:hypothetical protein